MMRGANILVTGAAVIGLCACAQTGELEIRAKTNGLAAGEQSPNFRVAEARGHLALGNVALALEGFRKALREDTGNVDAMNGIAACYDRMGRFDLSRRYYELALAAAPGDIRLYSNLALSLQMQGRTEEAASVRAEMTERAAGRRAALELATAETRTHEQPAELVLASGATQSITLPLPKPVSEAATAVTSTVRPAPSVSLPLPALPPAAPSVSVALPASSSPPARPAGARLERLSLGEVALVTSGQLTWRPRLSERKQIKEPPSAGVARSSPELAVTLLNAARSEGLAARAKVMLRRSGFGRIAIGDAPQVRRYSVIFYPSNRRAEAVQVANRFRLVLRHRGGTSDRIVVILGRDAATALRRQRG
jgi:hypothetical protein